MKDKKLLKWKFDELIKNLIVISFPANKQIEICGIGHPGDDIANDFDTYFNLSKFEYIKNNLLNDEQILELEKIDNFFNERSGKNNDGFWDNLESNSDWQILRQMAANCLKILKKDNLTITFKIKNKYTKSENGNKILIQNIKIKLINNKKRTLFFI
jgi:hypothetical protein